jgi:hypothetical protein
VEETEVAKTPATALRETIERELSGLRAITEEQAAAPPAREGAWSRKQELGHLVSSAVNNHVRFVRGTLEEGFTGPGYDQDGWVKLHDFNGVPWKALVEFWHRYNSLLAHLVDRIPEARLDARCLVGSNPPVTLGFLIEDYRLHMQHHLDHILGRETVTTYPGAALPA